MPRRGCPPERPWREGAQRASKAGLSLALVPRCRGAHTRAQTQTSSTGSATRPRRGALTHPVTKTFPNTRTHIYPGIRARSPGYPCGYPSTFPKIEAPVETQLYHGPAGALTPAGNRASSASPARSALPARCRLSRHRPRIRASPPPSPRLRALQAARSHLAGRSSARSAPAATPGCQRQRPVAAAGTHVPESPARLPTLPGQAGGGTDSGQTQAQPSPPPVPTDTPPTTWGRCRAIGPRGQGVRFGCCPGRGWRRLCYRLGTEAPWASSYGMMSGFQRR